MELKIWYSEILRIFSSTKKKKKILIKQQNLNNYWSNNYTEYKRNGDRNRILSVEEYLDKTRPYLRDMINDLKQSDLWKIQLTVTISFSSFRDDSDEERVIHSKSDNIEITITDQTDEIIEKLFNSLKNKYQNNLQSMRGGGFVFD